MDQTLSMREGFPFQDNLAQASNSTNRSEYSVKDIFEWRDEKLTEQSSVKRVVKNASLKEDILQKIMSQLVMEQEKTKKFEEELEGLRSRIEKIELLCQKGARVVDGLERSLYKTENKSFEFFDNREMAKQFGVKLETNLRFGKTRGSQEKELEPIEEDPEKVVNDDVPRKLNFWTGVPEGKAFYYFFEKRLKRYQQLKQIRKITKAIESGDINKVENVILEVGDINIKTEDNKTPLYMAAKLGQLKIVEWLLDNGAHIDMETKKKFNALHIAAMNGHLEIVQELVFSGVDAESETIMGATPLWLAVYNGHLDIVKWLASRYVSVNVAAKDRFTPLHVASQNGYLELVVWLTMNGANAYACTVEGDTALHLAVKNKKIDVVRYLAMEYELLCIANNNGNTALQLAMDNAYDEIVEVLHKAASYEIDSKLIKQLDETNLN